MSRRITTYDSRSSRHPSFAWPYSQRQRCASKDTLTGKDRAGLGLGCQPLTSGHRLKTNAGRPSRLDGCRIDSSAKLVDLDLIAVQTSTQLQTILRSTPIDVRRDGQTAIRERDFRAVTPVETPHTKH